MLKKSLSYKEAIKQSHREAVYTLIAAIVLLILFWLAVFCAENSSEAFWGLPLWFCLSCVGGYLLSVLAVWILVKFLCRNFDLTPEEDKK